MKRFLPVLLVIFGNGLWGQSRELWFSAGGSILSHTPNNQQLGSLSPDGDPGDVRIGNGYRFGFRFGFNSNRHIGHEIQYAYNRTRYTGADDSGIPVSAGAAFHQGGYNFLYYFIPANQGAEARVRPFVTAGVHFNSFADFPLPGDAAVQGYSIKPGFNYGAGLKLRVSTLFSVRFDLREYETGKPNWDKVLFNQRGLLHQMEASAGFGIFF